MYLMTSVYYYLYLQKRKNSSYQLHIKFITIISRFEIKIRSLCIMLWSKD